MPKIGWEFYLDCFRVLIWHVTHSAQNKKIVDNRFAKKIAKRQKGLSDLKWFCLFFLSKKLFKYESHDCKVEHACSATAWVEASY